VRVSEVLKAKQRKILTVGSDDVVKTPSSWISQAGEGLAALCGRSDSVERRPEMAMRTRIIKRSETFGFPTIVARLGLVPALCIRIEAALIGMKGDSKGGTLLRDLALDGFGTYPADLYEPIRHLANSVAALRPPAEQ
jgi:hypothetical protein